MKTTLTVLFLIAMLISTTQTFRHVYVKWIESTDSALDEFKNEVESDIAEAKSLEELVVLYRKAQNDVESYESDSSNPEIERRFRRDTEPYEAEIKIKKEIEAREYDENQLYKLWFYWSCGLLSVFIGVFTFQRINVWLGLSGIIVGFSEMLCWTSPLFHNRLLSQQFEYLLNYKLLFSLTTWILLIILWLLIEKKSLLTQNG
ncbi:MAG: hypothetical protein GY829_03195 [Gammaproteobacteria bacterium]|nr:hypothetical protein [Gammaproteobacteria bacterium]